jgi:hypothetical protein
LPRQQGQRQPVGDPALPGVRLIGEKEAEVGREHREATRVDSRGHAGAEGEAEWKKPAQAAEEAARS